MEEEEQEERSSDGFTPSAVAVPDDGGSDVFSPASASTTDGQPRGHRRNDSSSVKSAGSSKSSRSSRSSNSNNSFNTAAGEVDAAEPSKPPPPRPPAVDPALRGSVNSTYSYIGALDATEESFFDAPAPEKISEGGAHDASSLAVDTKAAAAGNGKDEGKDERRKAMMEEMGGSQSLVDVPLAGPPTPAMGDLTEFLDQAVYSLEEIAERSQAGSDKRGGVDSLASSVQSEGVPKSSGLQVQGSPERRPSSLASSTNSNPSDGGTSLPSYGFQPAVAEKSHKILRSYKPATRASTSGKFRGASLLAWRRGHHRRTSDASIKSLASVEEGDAANGALKNSKEGEAARTEVTESEDGDGNNNFSNNGFENNGFNGNRTSVVGAVPGDYSDLSVGSLLKDTYSFIYVYSACPPSAPFIYALTLFSFQALVYALLLTSLVNLNNPNNPLNVPPSATMEMRMAQACAILIAVFNSVDIMVALNNLLRAPDAIVVMDGDRSDELTSLHDIEHSRTNVHVRSPQLGRSFPAGFKFKFANILRLIEGCLAVSAAFILIVRSDDIIDMFINFAALEFVVNLDNLAFALAEHGLISNRLQDAARFVGGLGFSFHDRPDGGDRRRTKRNRTLKGGYLSRVLGWPVRQMTRRPDTTRRTTLFIMTLTMFGCWGLILSGLDQGDFLHKSLNVEFFHGHLAAAPGAEAEAQEDLKTFLSSRSGTYVAHFTERDASFVEAFSNLFTGRSRLFLAYRKVDLRVETPQQEAADVLPVVPDYYVEVAFFDPLLRRWIFATCDPGMDLSSRDRACSGPQVHSVVTDVMDLTALSSAPFHIWDPDNPVDPDDPEASSTILPAHVTNNECGPLQNPDMRSPESTVRTCGLTGGVCSAPRERLGFSRQCMCPPGQYGRFCDDHYGTSCPILEIVRVEGAEEPPGAAAFRAWETKPFRLVEGQSGDGNSPVWRRRSQIYTDRVEWRGGTHWTINRLHNIENTLHTAAIADETPAATDGPGSHGGPAAAASSVQPPPAGLLFYEPRAAAWGTQPDYSRPFSSYQFRCRAAPLGGQTLDRK